MISRSCTRYRAGFREARTESHVLRSSLSTELFGSERARAPKRGGISTSRFPLFLYSEYARKMAAGTRCDSPCIHRGPCRGVEAAAVASAAISRPTQPRVYQKMENVYSAATGTRFHCAVLAANKRHTPRSWSSRKIPSFSAREQGRLKTRLGAPARARDPRLNSLRAGCETRGLARRNARLFCSIYRGADGEGLGDLAISRGRIESLYCRGKPR